MDSQHWMEAHAQEKARRVELEKLTKVQGEEIIRMGQELAALREENEQLRKGAPIGPIVGAETIRKQEQELALCEMHCQEQAQRLDALREALDKAERLAFIDKWPERYPRVYGRMNTALNKEDT